MYPRHPFLLAPLCLALACSLSASAVAAQPQADSRQLVLEFDLPAASLAATLDQIALQSGRTIVYAPELARGLSAPALRERMTAEQAIARALSGTGLVLQVTPGGILTLDRQAADQVNLGEIMIDASAGESAWGPVAGYVATRSATGSKTDSALIEIPQTVNIVTHDQVQAQGAQNVTEAVRYTPGVIASFGDNDSRNDVLQSRGFFLRYNLNGSRLPYGAYSAAMMRIEPYGLERIEVLKGPASVLYGQNTPGGLPT